MSGALASREQCPAIPYTPAEYAAEARRVVDEGGVMVHLHARTPDGKPSHEIEDFRAITEAIRAEVGDAVIVNYSTGALGVPVEKRLAYLRELRPEIGALNMGSMNYAKYSARRKDFVFAAVFENSFETIRALLDGMVAAGIRPEHECFDSGHVASLDPLLDMGVLKPPLQVSFVMGVTGGIRPTARNVAHMAEQVPDVPHQWGVIGISRGAVGAAGRGAVAGRQRARGPGGQLLPAGRRDGAVQRRAGGAGGADGDRRRAAAGDGVRGAGDAGLCERAGRPARARPHAAAAGRLLHAAARRPRRRRGQGRGHRRGRLRARRPAVVRVAEPRQAVDPARPQVRGRARRRCCGWCATPTCWSSPSGRA